MNDAIRSNNYSFSSSESLPPECNDWLMDIIKARHLIHARRYGSALPTLKNMEKHSMIRNSNLLLSLLGEAHYIEGDKKSALRYLQQVGGFKTNFCPFCQSKNHSNVLQFFSSSSSSLELRSIQNSITFNSSVCCCFVKKEEIFRIRKINANNNLSVRV